jgi:hypothetical protein
MLCPFRLVEDTNSETFSEWNSECQRCRHFGECSDKADYPPGDNHPHHPTNSKSKPSEMSENKRQVAGLIYGNITKDEIVDFKIDLNTVNIMKELEKYETAHRIKNRRST